MQNGRNFADDTFECIFVNENASISIKISLKFVPGGQINNIPACIIRPQLVNYNSMEMNITLVTQLEI